MEPTATLARRLWHAIEPIHAVAYFDPEPVDALKAIGLRGGWMCYFGGRFAPLGAVGPGPGAAMAYGFAPRMVARSLPDAWRYAPPEAIVRARVAAAGSALRRLLPAARRTEIDELRDLLAEAAAGCRYEARPLAAGWMEVDAGDDPFAAIWVSATVLREHRGDGHVLAAVGLGLRGIDATITHVATGAITRQLMQGNRGWTDDEWREAEQRLMGRGLLDRDLRLTRSGGPLRRQLEETTDRLASGPVERLGPTGVEHLIQLAAPLGRHLVDTGVIPVPNPIGVPRP